MTWFTEYLRHILRSWSFKTSSVNSPKTCRIIVLGYLNFCLAMVLRHIIRYILRQCLWIRPQDYLPPVKHLYQVHCIRLVAGSILSTGLRSLIASGHYFPCVNYCALFELCCREVNVWVWSRKPSAQCCLQNSHQGLFLCLLTIAIS